MELKQNIGIRVPVRLRAVVDGSPLPGVTYQQATVYLAKQGGPAVAKVLGPTDWYEIDGTNMPGEYDLVLSASDVNTLGFLRYDVTYTGISMHYAGLVQVVANLEADTYTRLGAPAGASVSADVLALSVDVAATAANVSRIMGLVFDNIVEDSQVYDANANLTSARIRCYDTKAHAQAAGATGLLYQYTVTAAYDGNGNATLFQVVREQ
jgi:hypothetical protein